MLQSQLIIDSFGVSSLYGSWDRCDRTSITSRGRVMLTPSPGSVCNIPRGGELVPIPDGFSANAPGKIVTPSWNLASVRFASVRNSWHLTHFKFGQVTNHRCNNETSAPKYLRMSQLRDALNPRTCRGGGVGWTPPHGFSRITRVKRGGSPRNLQYPRDDQFDTYCENFKSMSCQVIKLWRHMSGHVRTKSADFAIYRTMVRFLASQRMSMHSMRVYWCSWMSRHHIQLTQGQGHVRSRFIGASSRSI